MSVTMAQQHHPLISPPLSLQLIKLGGPVSFSATASNSANNYTELDDTI